MDLWGEAVSVSTLFFFVPSQLRGKTKAAKASPVGTARQKNRFSGFHAAKRLHSLLISEIPWPRGQLAWAGCVHPDHLSSLEAGWLNMFLDGNSARLILAPKLYPGDLWGGLVGLGQI